MMVKRPSLTSLGIMGALVVAVAGLMLLAGPAAAQTVPTITPTPSPTLSPTPGSAGPSATPGPGPATQPAGGPGTATSSAPPVSAATATRRVIPAQTTPGPSPTALLAGVSLPTAAACSQEPTVRVRSGGAWLAEGPGDDYDVLGRLQEETVRPIAGRASDAAWWLIDLDDLGEGWIADGDVTVQGDTSAVPLVAAPPLPDGATPTPGPPWQPTPNAACLTPTPTLTAEPEATEPAPTPTATAVVEPPTATPTPEEPAAEPLPEEETGERLFWLPVAAIVLIAAGAFLYATRRS